MYKKSKDKLPVEKNEDVEFSKEVADREDYQALRRAHRADRRQEKKD
jgi:hypothetical protein